MVTVTKEHSSKQHVEQDFREASHNPNKLGPSRRLTSRLRILRRTADCCPLRQCWKSPRCSRRRKAQ